MYEKYTSCIARKSKHFVEIIHMLITWTFWFRSAPFAPKRSDLNLVYVSTWEKLIGKKNSRYQVQRQLLLYLFRHLLSLVACLKCLEKIGYFQ